MRRSHGHTQTLLKAGRVTLDPAARQVCCDDAVVELALREYELLHIFMLAPGRVLTRAQLEQHLYSWGSEVSSISVEVHISHLRRKLYPELIETVRGVGYLLPREAKS